MGRFKKLAIATVILLLIAVLGLLLYLNSGHFENWLRNQAVSQLEQRFDVSAGLEEVDLSWWATRVRLRGLTLASRSFPRDQKAIQVPEVVVDFSITSLLRPGWSLDKIRVRGLDLRMVEDENGRLNLMNMFQRQGGPPPSLEKFIRLRIGDTRIEEGTLYFEDTPFRIDSTGGGMELDLGFHPDHEDRYRGNLKLSEFELQAGGFQLRKLQGSISFELLPTAIQLPVVDLQSPDLSLQAAGAIEDISSFQYHFENRLEADIAALLELEEPIRGSIHSTGTFAGQGGDFRYQGSFDSRRISWRDWTFDELEGQAQLDRESANIESFRLRTLGGSARGSGAIYWSEEKRSTLAVSGQNLNLGFLGGPLEAEGRRLAGTAAAQARLSWPGLQFEEIGGVGQGRWQGRWLLAEPGVSGEPPPTYPHSGQAAFRFQGSAVNFDRGVADILGGRVEFEGNYDDGLEIEVRLEGVEGPQLFEFASHPANTPLRSWVPPELEVLGRARGQVSLQIEEEQFNLTGDTQLGDWMLGGQPLGDLAGRFQLSSDRLRIDSFNLRGPHELEGSLDLALGEEPRLLGLEVHTPGTAIEPLLLLSGFDLPLTGELEGDFRADFESGGLAGEGAFVLRRASVYGQAVSRLESRVAVEGSQVSLSDIEIALPAGTLRGVAGYDFGRQRISADLSGQRLALERFEPLSERVEVIGQAGLSLQISGTLSQPQVQADLEISPLQLAGYPSVETVRLRLSNSEADFEFLDFEGQALHGGQPLGFEGRLGLSEPYPVQLEAELQKWPLTPYLQTLVTASDLQVLGWASGTVSAQGELLRASDLVVSGRFPEIQMSAADYEVRNQEPLEFEYRDGNLGVRPVQFVGNQTELNVQAEVSFQEPARLTVQMTGSANLLLLNPFLDRGATNGGLQIDTVVSGPVADPRISGTVVIEKGFLYHPDLPVTIFEADGRLRFTADQVAIDELSARTHYGTVNLEGGVFLEGLEPVRWVVNVDGSGLRIEYPEEVFSTLDINIDLLKNEDSQLVTGLVYVRSAEYREQISLPELILRYSSASPVVPSGVNTGEETALDIDVEGIRTLQVDNNLAQITASGEFKIRGTVQNPIILGTLTVDEGKLLLENNEYEITRGNINFNNPRRTRPVLNFEAETEVRDVSVNIIANGPLDRLKINFRSDPPLPASSIVSLLAVGRTQEELFGTGPAGRDAGSLALFGAGTLLSKSLGQKLQEQSSRLFGFDRLTIDPSLYGSERNPGARVTLGKQLGNRLAVTYSSDLGGQTQSQIVVVEIKLSDSLTAVWSGDQEGNLALDIKAKKRF